MPGLGTPISDLWGPYPFLSLTHKSLTKSQESNEKWPQDQGRRAFSSHHFEMIHGGSCHLECLGSRGKVGCQGGEARAIPPGP